MTADRRAALEKAAMLVLMNGSGRITQELWADILKIIDLIRAEVERLRAALEKIDLLNTPLHGWSMSDLIDQEIVASGIRAAHAQEKKG